MMGITNDESQEKCGYWLLRFLNSVYFSTDEEENCEHGNFSLAVGSVTPQQPHWSIISSQYRICIAAVLQFIKALSRVPHSAVSNALCLEELSHH